MKVSATTIRMQAESLPQEELKHLVLDLVPLLEGGFSAELQHILETRRRAAELKSGEVEALASGDVFSRARQAIS